MNRVTKYVISSTMTEPDWQNSVILAGDPVDEVGRLKAMDGADIVLTGSITLAHLLIAEGLVDEFRMFGYPAVQGAGGSFPMATRQT